MARSSSSSSSGNSSSSTSPPRLQEEDDTFLVGRLDDHHDPVDVDLAEPAVSLEEQHNQLGQQRFETDMLVSSLCLLRIVPRERWRQLLEGTTSSRNATNLDHVDPRDDEGSATNSGEENIMSTTDWSSSSTLSSSSELGQSAQEDFSTNVHNDSDGGETPKSEITHDRNDAETQGDHVVDDDDDDFIETADDHEWQQQQDRLNELEHSVQAGVCVLDATDDYNLLLLRLVLDLDCPTDDVLEAIMTIYWYMTESSALNAAIRPNETTHEILLLALGKCLNATKTGIDLIHTIRKHGNDLKNNPHLLHAAVQLCKLRNDLPLAHRLVQDAASSHMDAQTTETQLFSQPSNIHVSTFHALIDMAKSENRPEEAVDALRLCLQVRFCFLYPFQTFYCQPYQHMLFFLISGVQSKCERSSDRSPFSKCFTLANKA